MTHTITQEPIAECTFLYQEGRCAHDEIADTLGKLLPAGFADAMKEGFAFRGPPSVVYTKWGPGMVTMRAGMPVESAKASGEFSVETLPACQAAVCIHTGSYDGLGQAHAALEQYFAEQKLEFGGGAREIYLTDPGEVPDPNDWKTQIVWPIA